MRLTKTLAALTLTSALALPAFAEMTDAERKEFGEEVRAYLLQNPEVLVEVMNELQAREQAAAEANDAALLQANADALFQDGASWVGGNPEGDITIVEFVDYRCGYCRKAHEEVAELVNSDGNIRFVMKEYPILGEQSLLSSKFAISVLQLEGPETYKQVHDALITLRADATPESLRTLAGKMSLDADAIFARMEAPEVAAVIAANENLGVTMQISGTPTFVIDNTLVRGYLPLDAMRQVVADQRAG